VQRKERRCSNNLSFQRERDLPLYLRRGEREPAASIEEVGKRIRAAKRKRQHFQSSKETGRPSTTEKNGRGEITPHEKEDY